MKPLKRTKTSHLAEMEEEELKGKKQKNEQYFYYSI